MCDAERASGIIRGETDFAELHIKSADHQINTGPRLGAQAAVHGVAAEVRRRARLRQVELRRPPRKRLDGARPVQEDDGVARLFREGTERMRASMA